MVSYVHISEPGRTINIVPKCLGLIILTISYQLKHLNGFWLPIILVLKKNKNKKKWTTELFHGCIGVGLYVACMNRPLCYCIFFVILFNSKCIGMYVLCTTTSTVITLCHPMLHNDT